MGASHRFVAYPDAALIDELCRVAALTDGDGPLTGPQFKALSTISYWTYLRHYGSWRQALQAAGLRHRYSGMTVSRKMRTQAARTMTNQQLIDELHRIQRITGRSYVTRADVRAHTMLSEAVYVARFGTWPAALAAAGLPLRPTAAGSPTPTSPDQPLRPCLPSADERESMDL